MPKMILFDLDGTITDSGEGIMNCAEFALRHFGLPVPSRETLRVFVGPPLDETFLKFGVPADKTDEAIRVYRSRYIPIGKFENTPYPGVRQLLDKLNTQGHTLYIATSKPEHMAVEILEKFGLSDCFQMICGATLDTSRSKKWCSLPPRLVYTRSRSVSMGRSPQVASGVICRPFRQTVFRILACNTRSSGPAKPGRNRQ